MNGDLGNSMPNKTYGSVANRNYRFYLVVDTSISMADQERYQRRLPNGDTENLPTPMSRLQEVVPALLIKLRNMPTLAGRTWMSVMTFGSTTKLLLPSTPTNEFVGTDDLETLGTTDFALALSRLHKQIAEDDERLPLTRGRHWWKPAIFFLTDGQSMADGKAVDPPSKWLPARNSLVEDHDANIVALGFGNAQESAVHALGTSDGKNRLAFVDEGELEAADLMTSISRSILRSITRSAQSGELRIELPEGMRWARP